jgi:hypothetical protein
MVNHHLVSTFSGLCSTHRYHIKQSSQDDLLTHKENAVIDVLGAKQGELRRMVDGK